MARFSPITTMILLPAMVLATCGRDREGGELARAIDEIEAPADTVSIQAEADEPEEPVEIVYDLTAFDWYRRGEPLIAGDRAYMPRGRPEPTRDRRFRRAGEYQGVAYYVTEDAADPPPVVYVPVSPGYWQPFATQPAGPPPAP